MTGCEICADGVAVLIDEEQATSWPARAQMTDVSCTHEKATSRQCRDVGHRFILGVEGNDAEAWQIDQWRES